MKRQLRNAIASGLALASPLVLTADRNPNLSLDEDRVAIASRYAGCAITSVEELPPRPGDNLRDVIIGLRTPINPHSQQVEAQHVHDPRVVWNFTVFNSMQGELPSDDIFPAEQDPELQPGQAKALFWGTADAKPGARAYIYATRSVETQNPNNRFRETTIMTACGAVAVFATHTDNGNVWEYDPTAPPAPNTVIEFDCPMDPATGQADGRNCDGWINGVSIPN
jgi:hypothetical protein